MKRPRFLVVAALALAAWLALPIGAQDLGALPSGVTWLNPPSQAEQDTSPSEKFVLLAREPIDDTPWNFIASIWEIDQDPEPALVPRVRFQRTHSSPSVFSYQSDFPHRDLIEVRSLTGSSVDPLIRIYRIDYRSWEIQRLWSGRKAVPLLWNDESVYFSTDNSHPWNSEHDHRGIRVIMLDSGEVGPPAFQGEQIRAVQRPESPFFLVHPQNKPEGHFDVFDAETEHIVASVDLPGCLDWGRGDEFAIQDGYSTCAVFCLNEAVTDQNVKILKDGSVVPMDFPIAADEPWTVFASGSIRIIDLQTKTEKAIPIGLNITTLLTSGVGFWVSGPDFWFTQEGNLRYFSSDRPTEDQPQVNDRGDARHVETHKLFEFDIKRGESVAIDIDEDDIPTWRKQVDIPDYLVEFADKTEWIGEQDIAVAFVRSKGIQIDRDPHRMDQFEWVFSDDGQRFALKLFESGKDDVIFLGNLDDQTLEEVPVPEHLQCTIAIDLICVTLE